MQIVPFLIKNIPDFHQTLAACDLEKTQPGFLGTSFLFLNCFKKIYKKISEKFT